MYNKYIFDKLRFKPRWRASLYYKYKFASDLRSSESLPEYSLVADDIIFGAAQVNRSFDEFGREYVLVFCAPQVTQFIIPVNPPANFSFHDPDAFKKLLIYIEGCDNLDYWRSIFEQGETHYARRQASRYVSRIKYREPALYSNDNFNVRTCVGEHLSWSSR